MAINNRLDGGKPKKEASRNAFAKGWLLRKEFNMLKWRERTHKIIF